MLGRTADGVFWMFRLLERAENISRLLETGFRLALTRGQGAARSEWQSVLVTIGQLQAYKDVHGEVTGPLATDWILRGKENQGSVLRMVEQARSNARAVRTALTREVWEATNEAWMVLSEMLARPVKPSTLGDVLSVIRRQSTLVRGTMDGTMLRNDIFNFARIGTFVERADNTARILDVKYYVLLPSVSLVGSSFDNAQWETVLRSVSAERAYRWLNAGELDPRGIADFLILDSRFPRSLASCYTKLESNIAGLARQYGTHVACHDLVAEQVKQLEAASIGSIIEFGLHEFIGKFLASNRRVADAIAADYRFTV
ncbi:alpha-E domain-containing protein [Novosphingobium sp. MW5]|nr:alpha-E domain-containing protein [Novosphingobium sp. MW5]